MADILVVDDEEDIVQVIQITLEARGHNIRVAYNGKQCLSQVKKKVPDLIVLDVMMPKMNGMQVVDTLRNSSKWNTIPIIMLTAATQYARKPDDYWQKKVGVDDYISKPFEPVDLLERVKKVLDTAPGADGEGQGRFRLK
jgi:DNA-binding response OmpR family regulator